MVGPQLPNARFWTWHNNGWVKITLKPGQQLAHATGGPTDEGYHAECSVWIHEGTTIRCEYSSSGYDCDGPHSRYVDLVCGISNLKDRPESGIEGDEDWMPDRPDWEKEHAFQRDLYAEMAGY